VKVIFVFFSIVVLAACSLELAPTDTIAVIPTSTEFNLPYNLVQESSEYCKSPYAVLSTNDAKDLSEDEIARKLIGVWLERYKKAEAHPYCRIDDYRVDEISFAPHESLPLEPKGSFSRTVMFSVKLIQIPNEWMSFSGEVDKENWLHTSHLISISKGDDEYTMFFVYP
jgi:hypothetical protein